MIDRSRLGMLVDISPSSLTPGNRAGMVDVSRQSRDFTKPVHDIDLISSKPVDITPFRFKISSSFSFLFHLCLLRCRVVRFIFPAKEKN